LLDDRGRDDANVTRSGAPGVLILYDEVYMRDDEWVRLLLSILRSLASESRDGSDDAPTLRGNRRGPGRT